MSIKEEKCKPTHDKNTKGNNISWPCIGICLVISNMAFQSISHLWDTSKVEYD